MSGSGRSRRRSIGLALCGAVCVLLGCTPSAGTPSPTRDRCGYVAVVYGLTPCPAKPLPVETVTVQNRDGSISDARADELARAYLRSRALYYQALTDNSVKFFRSRVIYLPSDAPLMFDSEIRHISDARARKGRLVVRARSTIRSIQVVRLTPDLTAAIGGKVRPMEDALMVTIAGPDEQDVQVPNQPSQTVAAMEAGNSSITLVAGILLTAPALEETLAEVGQWDCHDPDVSAICGVESG